MADEGNTLSLEFGKGFGLVLMGSFRTTWENVEKTGEKGIRTWHDNGVIPEA